MIKTKTLVLGGLLAVLCTIFQIIPVLLSEAFAILTILSAIPLYVVSRINPRIGIMTLITASIIIMLFSIHEAFFFVFTNGTVGLSLGAIQYIYGKKIIVPLVASLILTGTLCIMTFVFSIPVFGANLVFSTPIQVCILVAFSIIYCIIYFFISNAIFSLLSKSFKNMR